MTEIRTFQARDDSRSFPHGEVTTIKIGNATLSRAAFEPGWRWAHDVAEAAGTDSCQVEHLTYIVSGSMRIRMDDGTETDVAAGEVAAVPPGHDAWVLGDEPLVGIDFVGGPAFVEATNTEAISVACPCGVSFAVQHASDREHLIEAVQHHAASAHGRDLTREEIDGQIGAGR